MYSKAVSKVTESISLNKAVVTTAKQNPYTHYKYANTLL